MHIEGSPTNARKLARNRRDALNVEAVVCLRVGDDAPEHLMYSDAPPNYCRGPIALLPPEARELCEYRHRRDDGSSGMGEYLVNTSCTTLRAVFSELGLQHVNLLVSDSMALSRTVVTCFELSLVCSLRYHTSISDASCS